MLQFCVAVLSVVRLAGVAVLFSCTERCPVGRCCSFVSCTECCPVGRCQRVIALVKHSVVTKVG